MTEWSLEVECARQPRATRLVDLTPLIVGRGVDCHLQLADPRVSRQHCTFELRGPELWVEDLGSRAGTRVNGQTVATGCRLADGDFVDLSEDSRLHVRRAGHSDQPESEAAPGTQIFRDAVSLVGQHTRLGTATSESDLRRHAERLQLLNEVHRALAESPSRDALLEMILDRVFASLGPQQAAVLLTDGEGNLAEAVTRPAGLSPERVFFSRSLLREVTLRRQAALVIDAPADERFAAAASILGSGVRSLLAAPLLVPDGALGMIVLSSSLHERSFREEDLELLAPLASAAALHLRNLALSVEAAERRRLSQELELARRIQLALLPAQLPAVAGYELLAGNVPSRGVSGDLYKAELHPETGRLTCLVCDVSGKGMAASLLGASLEALSAGPIEVGLAPAELCARVSRRLWARTPPEKYATGFVARLDPTTHELEWANAGHNTALLLRHDGRCEELSSTGPPLGLLPTAEFAAGLTALAPGDLLLVYTDGITEAVDPDDEEFGLARLRATAAANRYASLGKLRQQIETALGEFVRGVAFADDRTMLFLRRCGS